MNMSELRSAHAPKSNAASKPSSASSHRELALIKLRRTRRTHRPTVEPRRTARTIPRRRRASPTPASLLNTYCNLDEYLFTTIRKGEQPNPFTMVRKLLPWAWDHRYDNLFAFDLRPWSCVPVKPNSRHGCGAPRCPPCAEERVPPVVWFGHITKRPCRRRYYCTNHALRLH